MQPWCPENNGTGVKVKGEGLVFDGARVGSDISPLSPLKREKNTGKTNRNRRRVEASGGGGARAQRRSAPSEGVVLAPRDVSRRCTRQDLFFSEHTNVLGDEALNPDGARPLAGLIFFFFLPRRPSRRQKLVPSRTCHPSALQAKTIITSSEADCSYIDHFRPRRRALSTPEAVDGRCCGGLECALHPWFTTRALDRRRYKGFDQTPSVASRNAAAGMAKNRSVDRVIRFAV